MAQNKPTDLTNLVAETGNNIEQLALNGLLNDSIRRQIEQLLPDLPTLAQIGGFNKEMHFLRGGKVGNEHVLMLNSDSDGTVQVIDTNQEVITLQNNDVTPTLQFFEIAPRGLQSRFNEIHGSTNFPDVISGESFQDCPVGTVIIGGDNEVLIKSTINAWNSTRGNIMTNNEIRNSGNVYTVLKRGHGSD